MREKRILFADGTDGFCPDKYKTEPTGGILTSLDKVTRYLASKGHKVTLKSLWDKETTENGVKYTPIRRPLTRDELDYDAVVLNRNLINSAQIQGAKSIGAKTIWWLHDITDPTYLRDDAYKSVDFIVSLSDYCTKTYSNFYGIRPEKFVKITNGVDTELWKKGNWEERDRFTLVMSSALIKGFKPIPNMYQTLKPIFPKLKLRIFSSQSLHQKENSPDMNKFLHLMKEFGAEVNEPVSQEQLANIYRKSGLLLMPNDYPEICSNTILQGLSTGLPIVTTATGANPEWIRNGENGIMTESFPHDLYYWRKDFTDCVYTILSDEKLHMQLSEAKNNIPSWDSIGEKWNELVQEL